MSKLEMLKAMNKQVLSDMRIANEHAMWLHLVPQDKMEEIANDESQMEWIQLWFEGYLKELEWMAKMAGLR